MRASSKAAAGREQVADAKLRSTWIARLADAQQIRPADGLVEATQAERGEVPANVLRHETEIGDDGISGPGVLRAQLRPLGRDPDRARVEMARAHEQATLSDEQRRAEGDLVRTEEPGYHNVAAGLHPAVCAHANTA